MAVSIALAVAESWEDHVEAWHHLGRQVDDVAWGRAAIAASLKGRYGEDAMARFAEEVGFHRASIYDFARTFEAFPQKSERSDNSTFSHHLIAVRLTANATEAKAALELATREGWSANALRAHLSLPPKADAAPTATKAAAPTQACATSSGACGPITTDDKIFHISSLIENFHAVKDYEIDPLVRVGTKKSLKELSEKVTEVIGWLQALNQSIKKRTK